VVILVVIFLLRFGQENLIRLGSSCSSQPGDEQGTHLYAGSTDEMLIAPVIKKIVFVSEMLVAILAVEVVDVLDVMLF